MRRRDFIKAIGTPVAMWPLAARAQQPMPVVGYLSARSIESDKSYLAAFRRALNETGYVEGKNVAIGELLFKFMTGVNLVHVPHRRAAPAVTDLLAGQVQVFFDPIPNSIGYIRAGKVRPLAITSATRSEALPDVPTVSEFVPGYDASFWFGVGAPKATPAEIVDKLNKEVNAALADPKMKARLAELGATAFRTLRPTSASSSLRKPRSGARWSSSQGLRRIGVVYSAALTG